MLDAVDTALDTVDPLPKGRESPATRVCQILLTTPASVTSIASFLPLPPPGAT